MDVCGERVDDNVYVCVGVLLHMCGCRGVHRTPMEANEQHLGISLHLFPLLRQCLSAVV